MRELSLNRRAQLPTHTVCSSVYTEQLVLRLVFSHAVFVTEPVDSLWFMHDPQCVGQYIFVTTHIHLSQGTKPCKVRLAAAMEFTSSLCLMVDDSMSDSAALLWLGQRCAAIDCFQHCVIAHGMHGLNYLSSRSSPSSALPLFPSST